MAGKLVVAEQDKYMNNTIIHWKKTLKLLESLADCNKQ